MIFVNDIPYESAGEEDPLKALHNTLAFAVDDWAATRAMAWIYGIVCGWDDESFAELSPRFRWSLEAQARLRRLHQHFVALTTETP